ncbi:MAG: hypothetical protein M3O36_17940, partial [Myxococcota bacterium]|nr:hypothetical protein [Myxococcota bacterium]
RPVQAADIDAGGQAPADAPGGAMAWFDARGKLLAIGTRDGTGRGQVLRGFLRGECPHAPAREGEPP